MAFGNFVIESGKALPLGATITEEGVNFAVFSRHASTIKLILFESTAADSPWVEIALDKRGNRTGDIWHCLVRGLGAHSCYLYRAHGPYVPERGLRYNHNKTLIDPYAKALTVSSSWDFQKCLGFDPKSPAGDLSFSYADDIADQPRCIIIDDSDFDWQGDAPLNYPLRFSV
jgi:glycogen operon protein